MKVVLAFALVALIAGCGSTPMKIDPTQIGEEHATLRIESPDLADLRSIPLVEQHEVDITLSRFPGCAPEKVTHDATRTLGAATLTPKDYAQDVSIPTGSELAIHAFSNQAGLGKTDSCAMAVRFASKPGIHYVLRFKPAVSPLFVGKTALCNMTLTEVQDGVEHPVPAAHFAVARYEGFWKGEQLDLCAAASDRPASGATAP